MKRQSMYTCPKPCQINVLRLSSVLMVLGLFLSFVPQSIRAADENSQFFSETNHTISGKFLEYWRGNGGLAAYGYPITDAKNEVDPETGKTFLTQWFERNRFELHPENAGTKYEVLLGLLGKDLRREALAVDPDFIKVTGGVGFSQPQSGQTYFPETGHFLRLGFLDYWTKNGGLERFGYPISEEHPELDPETAKPFMMQWFERARFEYHPENKAPYDILLGLLGNQLKAPKSPVDLVWKVGRGYNDLQSPNGVAIDGQGNVFVADSDNNQVQKFDSQGRFLTKWGNLEGGDAKIHSPSAIAVDRQGNVYVNDNDNNSNNHQPFWIKKFNAKGQMLNKWPINADGIGVDQQGNFYVLVGRQTVEKYDSSGHLMTKWGNHESIDSLISGAGGIALDQQDNVYLAVGNRVEKFDSDGHFLFTWGSTGSGDGQFEGPSGIAIDVKGNVFVADLNNNRVEKFDNKGSFLTQWGSQGSGDGQFFNAPYRRMGVAVDPQGQVYIIDNGNNRVQKFDSQGGFLLKWGSLGGGEGQFEQFISCYSVTVDKQGNVYILDSIKNLVQKFDNQGHFLVKWGKWGSSDGQFSFPTDIATDLQGNVYITDYQANRVQKFDNQGRFLLKWGIGGSGDGQFKNPGALAVDQQGNVFVADQKGVQKFDSQGLFKTRLPIAGGPIAVDQIGNIYVVQYLFVEKYDSEGRFVMKWGGAGQGDGQFDFPLDIAVDRQGQVYISDTRNSRVQKFDSKGQFLTKWGSLGQGDGQFLDSGGIAIDQQDQVFVTDGNQRFQKFRQH